jgi:RimJ/RimL family protein N-acetyltransferase
VSADPARWQAPAAAGYRLAEWTGRVPAELLLSYAAARNAIREAPRDGLSFTEPEWTAQRVRDEEDTAVARGCELRVVAAIHQRTGQVAGLTCLEVYQHRPELAVQQDTAVVQAHRGHGLGVSMKAANLRRLTAARPEVTAVITSNAADNEHMLRVNQQVGFQPSARSEIREAPLPELAARLLRCAPEQPARCPRRPLVSAWSHGRGTTCGRPWPPRRAERTAASRAMSCLRRAARPKRPDSCTACARSSRTSGRGIRSSGPPRTCP